MLTTREIPTVRPTARRTEHPVFTNLRQAHDDIRRELDVVDGVGRSLLADRRFRREHLSELCAALAFLDVVMPLHAEDEETTLFPELCRLDPRGARVRAAFERVREDHRGHGVLEEMLKVSILRRDAITAGKICLELADTYREHLLHEEETLFPWAEEVLTDRDLLDELAEEMEHRLRDCGLAARRRGR